MENINLAYLLLVAVSVGLTGFWHSRGHGLWSIVTAVFAAPVAIVVSIVFFTFIFNLAFVTGDEFLTLPDWLVLAITFAVWSTGVGSLFLKKEDIAKQA